MMENKTKIDLKNKSIFITGVAGFIGSNLAKRLLSTVEGVKVVGLDNMNNYYDVRLKEARLKELEQFEKFSFVKGNLADKAVIESIFEQYKPEIVVNLGAQAGVRYSITNPDAYVEANLIGFYNILEACRHSYDEGHTPVEHLVYASSSSVYGSNKKVPYSTDDKVDNPVSLYAATKKSNELMAHAYSKLYNIPSTGLRFFTVYGPAGRPDMAYFGFTNKLLKGETIQIFNYGNCKRDFTYVDDIVEGVVRVMQGAPERKKGEDGLPIPPYAVYNIGNQNPENLLDFVQILQEELIRAGVLPEDYDFEAHKKLVPMQPGDVPVTYVVVSASPEGILVSDKEQSSYIKPFVNMLDHRVMFAEKSWGSFKVIDIDKESMTIKVTLNAGHRMNYHSHQHRDEVWTVIAGKGKTIVDGMEQNVKAGDVITMSAGCRHTVIAETELKLIEVQLGKEIDVNDKQKFELEY